MAIVRQAVRVLLLDEVGRTLLFRAVRPETGRAFWFPPGGGLEAGEDAVAAAHRELEEETGLRGVSLGRELWQRRHVFTWRGTEYDQRERWFLAEVAHFEPQTAGLNEDERADLTDVRWWTADELGATTDDLVPPDLPDRLRGLLAGLRQGA